MPDGRAETLASIVVLYRQRDICKAAMFWNTVSKLVCRPPNSLLQQNRTQLTLTWLSLPCDALMY